MYFLSGSKLSRASIVFSYLLTISTYGNSKRDSTYIVNTIPPLMISRANLGSAPDQKVKTPSCLKIRAAQAKLFLYSLRASIDCILCTSAIAQPLTHFANPLTSS